MARKKEIFDGIKIDHPANREPLQMNTRISKAEREVVEKILKNGMIGYTLKR